ncbi:hypothetical protein CASFOL_024438 [Castilleja foliolosa]|uniref:RRM domain-containing protein n=1 Tax=Castilleja foliolosa TaxID=1961234 RepID=A0ABD3CPG9_9LAMI
MDPMKKRKIENGMVNVKMETNVLNPLMLTPGDARQIIEPLTHDQLLEIVQNALLRHPDVLESVRSFADRDVAQRKLFIRGLGWETTTEKLRALFSVCGVLDEAVVILDKVTGKSKGFGFITFKHVDGAIMALKEPSKQIDGRMTFTQLAAAGNSGGGGTAAGCGGGAGGTKNSVDVLTRKIYVSNLPYDISSERLLQHFSMYGEIEEGPLGFDKATGKSKGFALFVYKTAEAARASLVDPVKNVDGHQLSCKMAVDGKKGKPPGAGATGPNGVQGVNQGNGDGIGATVMGGQYGGPGGITGHYGGYSGSLGAGVGGPGTGLSAIGSQAAGSNLGVGGPYGGGPGGSHFGVPMGTGYGGLGGHGGGLGSGAGGGYSGMGGAGSGMGGAGRGSSFYPLSSAGMGSGDYLQGAQYGLSSGGYPGQHVPRVPPGGAYRGMPPYY